MDEDPEEYVPMKYSRDDEVPKGWAINDLARPDASQLGFYPASEFGVLTKLIQQACRVTSCHVMSCTFVRGFLGRGRGRGEGGPSACVHTATVGAAVVFFVVAPVAVTVSVAITIVVAVVAVAVAVTIAVVAAIAVAVAAAAYSMLHAVLVCYAQPKHIAFPKAMHISRNHYKQSWSFKTFRRIKNVIVLMDWVPDVTALRPETPPLGRRVSLDEDYTRPRSMPIVILLGERHACWPKTARYFQRLNHCARCCARAGYCCNLLLSLSLLLLPQ